MTLDEAIKHCEEVAKDRNETANLTPTEYGDYINSCRECAKEHEQLAEWLRELRRIRAHFSKPCELREPNSHIYKTCIDNGTYMLECPKCKGRINYNPFTYAVGDDGFHFCPYCGAKTCKEEENA